jgi:phage antirepressor YoqD-like protein
MVNVNKFSYQGSIITFQLGNGEVMTNATEMAKAFNKTPKDWLRTGPALEFINALSSVRHISTTELVIVRQGGDFQGTWMHEDVALEFARWLSPSFAIWCNDHIKQMLRTGQTSLGSISEDQRILQAMQILQQRVETTTKQLEIANTTISHQAPKVEYYDEVLDSKGLISTTIIAKDLGMSASALNRKLNQMGVIFRQDGTWVPYAKYQGNGFCKSKTFPYTDENGKQKTSIHFYWTEAGRKFLMEKLGNSVPK